MRIGEAMERTGLTRKALHYYEGIGLIAPQVSGNGYRDYSEQDIGRLVWIAALRRIDMPLDMVRQAAGQPEQLCGLLRAHHAALLGRQRELAGLVDGAAAMLARAERGDSLVLPDMSLDTLGERLRHAFPGGFGQVLEAHFQPFLQEPVETAGKRAALEDMVAYLDGLELEFPDLVEPDESHGAVQRAYWEHIDRLLELPGEERLAAVREMRDRQQAVETELAAQAPETLAEMKEKGARLKSLLQAAGYYEHVVANLRVISPRYDRYLAELERLGKLL